MNEKMITDKIKEELLYDFKNHVRNGIMALISKNMAYNSNRIEGSSLTVDQTATLFDTGTIVSNGVEVYKAKDIEEMNGHFKMFNEMLKTLDEPFTTDLIKRYHYQLKSGVFEDAANGYAVGEFKKRQNIVGMNPTAAPEDVPALMNALVNEYSKSGKTLEDIAMFHIKYETIHPFQDGNGRTGRMIIMKQCFDNGIIPVLILDEKRTLYFRALQNARDEKYDELFNFFNECQKDFINLISPMLDKEYIEAFEILNKEGKTY